jgi:putative ABC transport system permease protein
MNWNDIRLRLRALFQHNRVEDELEEEVNTHLEMQARKNQNQNRGIDPAEASRLARIQFGSLDVTKEECRDARGTRLIEDALADVRYAVRSFRRTPVFALTVVATIALPLGLNTALFTIFNAYVFRPVAVSDPNSLYQYSWTDRRGATHSFSWAEYESFRDGNPVFSEVAATRPIFARVEGQPLFGELVTPNYFRMLGVGALSGRTFVAEDGASAGSAPVVVLSHSAWQNKFGGNNDLLGKTIVIRGHPLEVIGITKPEFSGLNAKTLDFWVPITMADQLEGGPSLFGPDHPNRLDIAGRLRPGLTSSQAEAALLVWARHRTDGKGEDEKAVGVVLESRATSIRLTPQLIAAAMPVVAAFLLVLLIACANIASMILARAIVRQREIGLRLSLGAARVRLVRQLLTESLVLAVPAAMAGAALSELALRVGQRILFSAMPPDLAQIVTIPSLGFDIRLFGFLIAIAASSATLFGLAPALQATRLDLSQVTKGEFAPDMRPTRLRNALVIFQITVCVMLLTVAGLALRASSRMNRQEVGFTTRGVLEMDINEKYRSKLLSRLAEQPVVEGIASAQSIPLNGMLLTVPMISGEETAVRGSYNFVSPTFFEVLGIPILSGRNFSVEDAQVGAAVAIVSQKTALRFWPGQQPLGQTLRLAPDPRVAPELRVRRFPSVRIIGVAADIVSCCFTVGMDPTLLYLPTTSNAAGTSLLVRVHGNSEQARRNLDANLSAISPSAVDQIHTLETFRAAGVFPFQIAAGVCTVIGGLALFLAVSGVYGVLSYSVSQRTREIGIRMAIGAPASAVARLVLTQSMRLALIGGVAGSLLALAVWRILASRLFFIQAFDGIAFFIGVLVPLAAAALAAYVPARRAILVDPITTLRYD